MNNPTYLDQYRESLLAKQRELLTANGGRVILAPAGGLAGADETEQAVAEREASIEAHVSQARSRQRKAIEGALVRLNKGNYGLCTACGNPISDARLKAVPWTDYCRDCMEHADTRF